jgi:diguanylate cyclase (GGDEF)-like protein
MLGFAESEFGNTPEEWFRRIHPEDSASVKREIEAHLEAGSTQFEMQHRMLHQDGCYRWMSCRGVITRDGSGRAIRIAGIHADITAEKVVDSLTGLPNRLLLLERLTRSIEKARKQADFLFAVLIVDLDLFESGINGLETVNCDSLVVAAARRLETALRTKDSFVREGRSDLVARIGDGEFIILVDGLSELSEATTVAERLLKVILAPFALNGREVSLSASIGIALSVTDYRNPEDALRDAETALHRAKSLGKSRCEVFDTAILKVAQVRHQLEQDLQGALSRNEFLVHYQPIVSLASNTISGFEALVRWNHPSRGMVSPMDFIPVAEKKGLIIPLNRWVMREACRQLKEWKSNPRISKDLWVSVNLSGSQFMHLSLVEEIREILREVDLDAGGLMLELTEGMVMEHPEEARRLLMQLRIMGARIALDDFGTGYSSLAYLRRFPLDFLKIDYSFVRSIENGTDQLQIIRTICILAHQLGLRVIAEGIENSRQLDLIRSLDCECGQGFLFSRAVGSEQAETLLLNDFAPQDDAHPLALLPEKTDSETDPPPHLAVISPVPAFSRESGKKLKFWTKRKYVLAGLTALILLFMGGLLSRSDRLTSPPVAPAKPEGYGATAAIQEIVQPPSAEKTQTASAAGTGSKPLAEMPKAAKKKASVPVYTYEVVHDHRLGSCVGTMKIGRDGIAYIADDGKDSFYLKHSECSCILNHDQLIIRSASRIYRFKSAAAVGKDENRSHLSEIFQSITRFHPGSASQQY